MISKKLEIFCGTGGVGKTTLATSRAAYLSKQGKKVLLMTVDPSKRLKQVLNLKEEQAGRVEDINLILGEEDINFKALLLLPESTFYRVFKEHKLTKGLDNKILQVLVRPYGGLNEILGLLELQHHLQGQQYDTIVLDTPPGSHFVDFLESGDKIHQFFNKSFMDVFQYFNEDKKRIKNPIQLAFQTGIKKIIDLLEGVTGKSFVEDFINAISTVYELKNTFIEASSLPQNLKKNDMANWFLVTALNHRKIKEAQKLQQEMKPFISKEAYFVLNKSFPKELKTWEPKNQKLQNYQNSLNSNREIALNKIDQGFSKVLEFPEIMSKTPLDHIKKLVQIWEDQ